MMARYVVEHRLAKRIDLGGFDVAGYRLDAAGSTDTAPLFTREQVSAVSS